MKRIAAQAFILTGLLYVLTACTSANAQLPSQTTAPTELPVTGTTFATEATLPLYGWQESEGQRYYLYEDGTYAVGWLELEGKRYYLNENGVMQTGWLELEDRRYYLRPDGTMARGKTEIEGNVFYFTSSGAQILMANPWNRVPENYMPDLVPISSAISSRGSRIDRRCYDALVSMMADCKTDSGASVYIVSAYRNQETQTVNYNKMVNAYLSAGYSQESARAKAAKSVAVPGTSEHQLGLAVDIIDTRCWSLTPAQADLPGQKWLMENCWRYGFILRYPEDKTEITGIVYEPWHYRYVGLDVAAELHASGLTLEEYLESLNE